MTMIPLHSSAFSEVRGRLDDAAGLRNALRQRLAEGLWIGTEEPVTLSIRTADMAHKADS